MSWVSSLQEHINSFFLIRWIRWLLIALLTVPIKIYQWIISPALPKTCRYHPTCSEYALEALKRPQKRDTFEYGYRVGMVAGYEASIDILLNLIDEDRNGRDEL